VEFGWGIQFATRYLADVFEKTYENFNREKFLQAAGHREGEIKNA
jgi:hypothetical protein